MSLIWTYKFVPWRLDTALLKYSQVDRGEWAGLQDVSNLECGGRYGYTEGLDMMCE